MRESWTDARLDDFAANTRRRFDQVDRRFDVLERRMEEGFTRVDADIRELRSETASFHRMILQLGGGMIVTFAVGFAGLIIAQL